jgi:multiple antibiotic resistance protein
MILITLFLKTFVGFFAVMDPIGVIPVFIVMTTTNTERERALMARRSTVAALLVLLFFGVTQMWLFNFFGFTMGAFRVAGGLFLFLIAFEMMTAQLTGARQSEEEKSEGVEKPDISITPLAVPLLAGPATIASVVLAFSQAKSVSGLIAVGAATVAVAFVTWLILRGSGRIQKLLGTTGIKVVSRMMGLVLAAMAIQFVAEGLSELFPILASRA